MHDKRIIADLVHIAPNSRVCLFGAGEFGKKVLNYVHQHRPDITVPFIGDSYATGRKFGLELVSPAQLAAEKKDLFDVILVASVYYEEIVATLEGLGIANVLVSDYNLLMIGRLLGEYVDEETGRYDYALVELTTHCNMECDFCGHKLIPIRHRRSIDFDFFKEIIDQLVRDGLTKTVHLYGNGEPLLYPRLDEAIRYCKVKGLRTILLTNGLLLTSGRYTELLASGLDHIFLSFHSMSQASFNYRRPSSKIAYPQYRQNMLKIVDYHAGHDVQAKMTILLMFSKDQWVTSELWDFAGIRLDTRHTRTHCAEFYRDINEIADRHGKELLLSEPSFMEAFSNMLIDNTHGLQEIPVLENITFKFNTLIPLEYSAMQRLVGDKIDQFEINYKREGTCTMLQYLRTSIDGSIMFCCRTPLLHGEFMKSRLGRISAETTILDIINSKRYRDMLKGFRENRVIESDCQRCLGGYSRKEGGDLR